jgi:Protein of unknown function (DUF3137)
VVSSQIEAFYEGTLKPRLDAIDDRRRQVRWLIIKALIVVVPPSGILLARDLLAGVLPFLSTTGGLVLGWVWLAAAIVFAAARYVLPGMTAYANYRSRFKQDIVAEVFRFVCPSSVYDPLQGITSKVFDAPGLFSTRGAFESDDRVRGHIGQTPFEASEAGRSYSTGSGRNSHSYVVFRGLFVHFAVNQRLSGVTLIDPKAAKSHQLGDREGLSLVTVDNQAFEKEFKVHASNESEARALLTPSLIEALLTLRRQAGKPVFLAFRDQRAFFGVDYGRTLFEPGIARTTSKAAVGEIAEHFAFVETVVRELNVSARGFAVEGDESLFRAPDVEPDPLSRLAAEKGGTLTPSDVWTMASASIDESGKDGASVPRPEQTRISLVHEPTGLSITYGLRLGFWVMLAISLAGALLASSALRAPDAPEWAGPASAWVRTLPPLPRLDAFAASAPVPWLIVGTVVAVLFALMWTIYVRRVEIDTDRIRIYRGLRPFPRVYHRPKYGRAIRVNTYVYIAKSEGVHVMNPTASPLLTEAEAKWLTSEMKRALGQT